MRCSTHQVVVGERWLLHEGEQKILGLLSIPAAQRVGLIGARLPQRIANLVCYQVGEEGGGLDAAEISDARILVGEPLSHEGQNTASPPTCSIIQNLAQEATQGSNLTPAAAEEPTVGAPPSAPPSRAPTL